METTYRILRPCWFFAQTEIVTRTRMKKWFTDEAISELEKYGYIEKQIFKPL